jgi:hypothetical protein
MPVIPTLGMVTKEDLDFEAGNSLGYMANSASKTKNTSKF